MPGRESVGASSMPHNYISASTKFLASHALQPEDALPLDGVIRQRLLMKLGDLEDIFYHFVDYIETREDELLTRINAMRDALEGKSIPVQELASLNRTIDQLQSWPREMVTVMEDTFAALEENLPGNREPVGVPEAHTRHIQ